MGQVSLSFIAKQAGISRQTARTCVKNGLLHLPPYDKTDAVLLRLAAACLESAPRPVSGTSEHERNMAAMTLARAFLKSGLVTNTALLVVGAQHSEMAEAHALGHALLRYGDEPCLVVPIGRWLTHLDR